MKKLYDHDGQTIEEIEGIQVVCNYSYTQPVGVTAFRGEIMERPEHGCVEIGSVILVNDAGCSDILPIMHGAYIDLLRDKIRAEVEE